MRNPFENPDESLTHSPEYLAELLQTCEEELERTRELYSLMRADLVEKEAWALHGGFQAAASGKGIEECRQLASYKLRVECPHCGGYGQGIEGEPGAQHQTFCADCDGSGFIQLPALEWMRGGKVQFALLPKNHPDYDPTK